MKKKFATMILIGSLICMSNCTVIQAYEQQEVNGDISIVSSDKILNYDHYELQTDDDGKPAIVIYFEFTNNTDEAKSASSSYWFDVFQNGIERDSTTIPNNDSFSDGLHYHVTDIKNGATVNTCFARELDDTTTEVELEVKSKDTSEVQKLKIDISKYDTIYLGFPIWWYVAPTIVNTFLEKYDFSGKKIIVFATSGSSGMGNTISELKPSAPDAEWGKAERLSAGISQSDIDKWVNE